MTHSGTCFSQARSEMRSGMKADRHESKSPVAGLTAEHVTTARL
jgi:hypothetical protein